MIKILKEDFNVSNPKSFVFVTKQIYGKNQNVTKTQLFALDQTLVVDDLNSDKILAKLPSKPLNEFTFYHIDANVTKTEDSFNF
jgi:hypothetical protein